MPGKEFETLAPPKRCLGDGLVVAITVSLLFGFLKGAWAASYIVGGDAGWIELPQESTAYDDQFKDIELVVGDELQFIFVEGSQNVVQVKPMQLADCDGTDPIAKYVASNTTITLSAAGYLGFICGVGTHCSDGAMHMAVNVSAYSTAAVQASDAHFPPSSELALSPSEITKISVGSTVGLQL